MTALAVFDSSSSQAVSERLRHSREPRPSRAIALSVSGDSELMIDPKKSNDQEGILHSPEALLRGLCRQVMSSLFCALLSTQAAFGDEPYRVLVPSGTAQYPAVLLVPGCSGFAEFNGINIYEDRGYALQTEGYMVVFVDYLGRHDQRSCAYVSRAAVGEDALEAAQWTRVQAHVDASAMFAVGWSYGAGGILAALAAMPPGIPLLSRAVMYYPDCRTAKPWSAPGVSALMFLGSKDEVAFPDLCTPIVNGVPTANLRTVRYANARHLFDVRSLPEVAQYPFGTVGYDADAADESWRATIEFLK